jgi:enoyl-CoA hydratase/carnithine racemase
VRDGLVAGVRWFNDGDAVEVLVLTGAGRSAQRAFQIGFVNPTIWRTPTRALAAPIAANDPLSTTAGKWTAMITAEYPLSESFERTESIRGPVYLSVDT